MDWLVAEWWQFLETARSRPPVQFEAAATAAHSRHVVCLDTAKLTSPRRHRHARACAIERVSARLAGLRSATRGAWTPKKNEKLIAKLDTNAGGGVKQADFVAAYTAALPEGKDEFSELCEGFRKIGNKARNSKQEALEKKQARAAAKSRQADDCRCEI